MPSSTPFLWRLLASAVEARWCDPTPKALTKNPLSRDETAVALVVCQADAVAADPPLATWLMEDEVFGGFAPTRCLELANDCEAS